MSMFDLLAMFLFGATAGLYLLRLRHERPTLAPYLVVFLVSIVGAWLGNNGAGPAAVALLIAGSFLTLHLAGQPYNDDAEEVSK